jgi:hypothetical protein
MALFKTCTYCRLFTPAFLGPTWDLVVFEPTGQLVDRWCHRFLTKWQAESIKGKAIKARMIAERRARDMAAEDAEAESGPTEVEILLRGT